MTSIKCPHCSQQVSSNAKFCSECGAPLSKKSVGAKKKAPGGPRDILIIAGTIVIVLIGYFVLRDKPDEHAGHDHATQGSNASGPTITPGMLDQLPKDYNTLVGMGNQFMDEGNFPVASEIYRRALVLDGSDPNVRTDYGACLHGMGMPDKAIEQFMLVLKDAPTHGIAHFNLGIVYLGMNVNDSARVYWEKYLTLEPTGKAADAARDYLKRLDG